jgi:hypothetical protein
MINLIDVICINQSLSYSFNLVLYLLLKLNKGKYKGKNLYISKNIFKFKNNKIIILIAKG